MNSTAHNYTDPLNICAAFFVVLMSAAGLTLNGLIVYIFIRSPSERTSFNVICVFRAVANSVILFWAFLATFLPIILLGDSPFSPLYETLAIGTSNTIVSGIHSTGMYIAINRFCAMYFPTYYSKLFGLKLTTLLSSLIFVYRFIKITYEFSHYIPLECWMTFDSIYLTWNLSAYDGCVDSSTSVINSAAIFLSVMVAVNIATFAKIYLFYKSTDIDAKERNRKQKKNRALFLQTVTQDTITLLDVLFTFKLSFLNDTRVWQFFCGTVIWATVHSLDGLIMVTFNERLSFLKKTFFASSNNNSVAVPVRPPTASVAPSMYMTRVG